MRTTSGAIAMYLRGPFRLRVGLPARLAAGRRPVRSTGGIVYFLDGNHEIWSLTDAGVGHNTGGFATRIASNGDSSAIFFTDGNNQIWELQNGVFTLNGAFTLKMSCF
jgi:hypothetical protein